MMSVPNVRQIPNKNNAFCILGMEIVLKLHPDKLRAGREKGIGRRSQSMRRGEQQAHKRENRLSSLIHLAGLQVAPGKVK